MKKKEHKKIESKKTEHKKVTHNVPKQPMNVWMAISVILAIVLVLGFFTGGCNINAFSLNEMSGTEVAENVIDFLNTEGGLPADITAEFDNVNETAGLYLVTFTIEGQAYNTFATKDGRYLFPQAIDLSLLQQDLIANTVEEPVQFDAPDSEVPVVKFFVMSFCPYGQQAESGLQPVYDLFKDSVIFEPHFVVYSNYASRLGATWDQFCLDEEEKYCSMHGVSEINEDIRQMCIYNNYDSDVWWNYVSTINSKCSYQDVDTCWKNVAEANGVDVSVVEDCFANEAETIAAAELALNEEYSVTGSPTVFVNEERYNQARSPEAFKTAICSAFSDVPEDCSQGLSTESTADGSC